MAKNKKPSSLPWVVLFGGSNRDGVISALQESKIKVETIIVPENKNKKLADSIDRLSSLGIPIVSVTRESLAKTLEPFEDHVLLSVGFPYIIPSRILYRHKWRLNIHPTLLPKYKGPTSAAYILINGETRSGSTVHIMEDEVDSGAIVCQSVVEVDPFDTVRSLQRKVYATEPELIIEAVKRLDSGAPLIYQNVSEGTIYKKRVPADSEIDPKKSLVDLFNYIRACDPDEFPAFFYWKGQKVCIRLWRPNKGPDEEDMI